MRPGFLVKLLMCAHGAEVGLCVEVCWVPLIDPALHGKMYRGFCSSNLGMYMISRRARVHFYLAIRGYVYDI